MGRYGPASVGFLLIGGMNVRSRVATVRIKTMTETEETRPLGESWEQHTPIGIHSGELEQTGCWRRWSLAANELNAIRARDGAPQHIEWDRGRPLQTSACTEQWWDELTDRCFAAIAKARGEADPKSEDEG